MSSVFTPSNRPGGGHSRRHAIEWSGRTIALAVLVAALLPARVFGTADTTRVAAASAGSDTSSAPRSIARGYVFPSPRDQWRTWALDALGPSAIAGNFVGASWRHWATDEPEEWDTDATGLARRFGTGSFATFTSATWLAAGSAAMRQDPNYYRSPQTKFGLRVRHAAVMAFAARDREGDMVFSPSKTLASFAGAVATTTAFYPDRYSWTDGLVSGAYGVLINVAWNTAKEFVVKAPPWRSVSEAKRQGPIPEARQSDPRSRTPSCTAADPSVARAGAR